MAEPLGPGPLVVINFPALVLRVRIADLQTAGRGPTIVSAEE